MSCGNSFLGGNGGGFSLVVTLFIIIGVCTKETALLTAELAFAVFIGLGSGPFVGDKTACPLSSAYKRPTRPEIKTLSLKLSFASLHLSLSARSLGQHGVKSGIRTHALIGLRPHLQCKNTKALYDVRTESRTI